ncbi:hypothetical protein B7494_g4304 [Chlorociboria aeruginascens]|nr:hypothetical protein B7494_g4304 [Chlorociboria aeruginascens]
MKLLLLILSLILNAFTVHAVLPRDNDCNFYITAVGYPNGTARQSTIGQIRIGGGWPQASFIINANNLSDTRHHNCVIMPDSFEFQCVSGYQGLNKFSLADNGYLLHEGSPNYVACSATGPSVDGSWNVFSDAKPDTTGCQPVKLVTGGFSCAALGKPTPSSSSQASTPTSPLANQTSPSGPLLYASIQPSAPEVPTSCPTDISGGTFQFPCLTLPISKNNPNGAYGNSSWAYISEVNATIFNFDIPATDPYTGTCALLFLFPFGSELDPSAGKYYFTGMEEEIGENGGLEFFLLDGIANMGTTNMTTPAVKQDLGKVQIIPGNVYTVATFQCAAGISSYKVESRGNVELDYYQSSLQKPVGIYIVPCA